METTVLSFINALDRFDAVNLRSIPVPTVTKGSTCPSVEAAEMVLPQIGPFKLCSKRISDLRENKVVQPTFDQTEHRILSLQLLG